MSSFQQKQQQTHSQMNKFQAQSLSSQKQQKQISNTWHHNSSNINRLQLTTINNSFSASQTIKHPEKRRSLNNSKHTVASTSYDSSQFSKKTGTNNKRWNDNSNDNAYNKNNFSCPYCINNKSSNCQICKGLSNIKDDCAIIKFFTYIVQYKRGEVQSYTPKQKDDIVIKNNLSKTAKLCRSQRLTIVEKKQQFQNIHYGYFCNICNDFNPIKGSRFTCNKCQDYDLCSKCYKQQGHHHMMKQIENSPSYKLSMNCYEKMKIKKGQNVFEMKKTSELNEKINKLQQKLFCSRIIK